MTLRPVTPPQQPAEARRAEVERQLSVENGVARLAYFLDFQGAGESFVDVNFPCRFINEPFVSSGVTLDPGTVLAARNYPWGVASAILRTEERAGHLYYVAATIVMVSGGPRRQKFTAHVGFEGKAIVGPVTE